jgi:uncharacterized protein (DUF4415 family)
LSRVVVEWPKEKKTITIRLDSDVIDWLKLQGKGYQTRINAVLRAYMKHVEKRDNG